LNDLLLEVRSAVLWREITRDLGRFSRRLNRDSIRLFFKRSARFAPKC